MIATLANLDGLHVNVDEVYKLPLQRRSSHRRHNGIVGRASKKLILGEGLAGFPNRYDDRSVEY
jgi:hypothetical protein